MTIRVLALAAITLAIGCAPPAWSDLALPISAAARASDNIYDFHLVVLWSCVAIALVVYSAMVVAIVRFKRPEDAKPSKFSVKTGAEVIWTIIPAVIMIGLSIPAVNTLLGMQDRRNAELAMPSSIDRPHRGSVELGAPLPSPLERGSRHGLAPQHGVDTTLLGH
jgi:cytochrome c oxidase subunit 2